MTESRYKSTLLRMTASMATEEELQNLLDKLNLFRRKATNTKLLRDDFKYLESIAILCLAVGGYSVVAKDSWRRSNEAIWKEIESNTFRWLLLMVYQQEQSGEKSWPQIFYEYYESGECVRNNILLSESVRNYSQLLVLVKPFFTPEMQDAAEELIRFFKTHTYDPFSSVIGQRPSKEIMAFSQSVSDDTLNRSLAFDVASGEAAKRPTEYKERYSELLSMLVYWSTLSEKETLRNIRKAASTVRGVQGMEKGALVLANLEDDFLSLFLPDPPGRQGNVTWRYARVAGYSLKSEEVLLFKDPSESSVISVPFDRVVPVAPEMITKYFADKSPSDMGNTVVLFSTIICDHIAEFIRKVVKRALLDVTNIEEPLFQSIIRDQCRIEHQSVVRKLSRAAKKALPSRFAKEVQDYVQKVKEKCQANWASTPAHLFFQLTKDNEAQTIMNYDELEVVQAEMLKYRRRFKSCLKELEKQKRDILSGKRKVEISEAYLSRISTHMGVFLGQHGYEMGAVPQNYLDQPPSSILAVRRNLVLLRRILKTYHTSKSTGVEQDPFRLSPLIQDVTKKIYQIIDEFLRDLNYCLAEQLKLTYDDCLTLDSRSVKEKLADMELSEERKEQVEDMVADKCYLQAMIELENNKTANPSEQDIIPISGLVVSKLSRLENECKTVLDLWETVRIPKNTEESRTPLENAVITSDMKALESLLRGSLAYINDSDPNGWTALHLSCSYCFNEDRLPVTQFLLSFDEVDVTATNNFGNTPLHNLARMPVTDDRRPLYRDCLRMMIEKAPDVVYCENSKGETPLHHASLAANAVSARLLLEAGSDPNVVTKEGDSPLHYAVKSTNADCVRILLSYSADHRIKNSAGETAEDIARKLNLMSVANALQKQTWDEAKGEEAKRKSQLRTDSLRAEPHKRPSLPSTELPSVPLNTDGIADLAPSEKRKSRRRASTAHMAAKKPTISDPSQGSANWKKAPVPDDVRDAMLKLVDERKSDPPPVKVSREQSLSMQIMKEAHQKAAERTKRMGSDEASHDVKICRVLWDVKADDADELSLQPGDLVEVIEEDESGWWTGRCNGAVGTFPVNFTQVYDSAKLAAESAAQEPTAAASSGDDESSLPSAVPTESTLVTPQEPSPEVPAVPSSPPPQAKAPRTKSKCKSSGIVKPPPPSGPPPPLVAPDIPAPTPPVGLIPPKEVPLVRPPVVEVAAEAPAVEASLPEPPVKARELPTPVVESQEDTAVSTTVPSGEEPESKGPTRIAGPKFDRPTSLFRQGRRGGRGGGQGATGTSVSHRGPSTAGPPRRGLPLPTPDAVHATVIADFDAVEEGELAAKEGTLVQVITQFEDGWWQVKYQGKEGLVPASHLEVRSRSVSPSKI